MILKTNDLFTVNSFGVLLCPERGKLITAMIGDHGGLAGLPARGANLTMLIGVLECLYHAEDFVNVAANGKIVHAHLAENAFAVNDVSGTQGNASVLGVIQKAAVVAGNLLGNVGDHGNIHGAKATLLTRLHRVFSVRELRVDRAANKLAIDGFKLGGLVAELANLSRADEGKVEGPEEKHNILSYNQ